MPLKTEKYKAKTSNVPFINFDSKCYCENHINFELYLISKLTRNQTVNNLVQVNYDMKAAHLHLPSIYSVIIALS